MLFLLHHIINLILDMEYNIGRAYIIIDKDKLIGDQALKGIVRSKTKILLWIEQKILGHTVKEPLQ